MKGRKLLQNAQAQAIVHLAGEYYTPNVDSSVEGSKRSYSPEINELSQSREFANEGTFIL